QRLPLFGSSLSPCGRGRRVRGSAIGSGPLIRPSATFSRKGRRKVLGAILAMGFASMTVLWAADAKPADSADQTDSNYYWQGTELYNLGRLGEAFESFEKAIQRKQNTKEAEAYLLQIRQEIVNNAKKRSDEKNALVYDKGSPETALNVAYVQKGYSRVTIQAKFVF